MSNRVDSVPLTKRFWRKLYWAWRNYQHRAALPPLARLQEAELARDFSHIKLSDSAINVRTRAVTFAKKIHGDRWDHSSFASRTENLYVLEQAVAAINAPNPAYLEIGSALGMSMSIVGSLLPKGSRLVSIDPYFETGYLEGGRGPYEQQGRNLITKHTKSDAQRLYEILGLDVSLFEVVSSEGLRQLILKGESFDLIYIDGVHEGLQPVIDFGLSLVLLKPNGVIMLDDHRWPDVRPVKELCDDHAVKIAESWKVVAYTFPTE
jgi:predicted O-methyltransferase YrrM